VTGVGDRTDLTVELAQVGVEQCWADPGALERNTRKLVDWYERAADDTDLVAFPELALTGYIPLKGYDQARKRTLYEVALRCQHEALPALAERTRGRRASLAVGFMEPAQMRHELFNSLAFLEDGELLGVHRKIHLPVEENHYFVPGEDVTVVDSRCGRVALLVCYDMLFPESARIAALRGAEILCISSNWLAIEDLEQLAEVLPTARALEEQLHVLFVNGVGEASARGRTWSFFGKSRAVAASGELLGKAGREEERVRVVLERDQLARAAAVFPLLRDRRPQTYADIVRPSADFAALTDRRRA
jgi:predicted amidohydrolase